MSSANDTLANPNPNPNPNPKWQEDEMGKDETETYRFVNKQCINHKSHINNMINAVTFNSSISLDVKFHYLRLDHVIVLCIIE